VLVKCILVLINMHGENNIKLNSWFILTMLSFIFINCIESFLGFHILLSVVYRNNFVCVLICTSMIL
jgi:hypothetical protein